MIYFLQSLIDMVLLILIFLPSLCASYIWQNITTGWLWGEYFYNPDLFAKKYGISKLKL